MGRLGFHADHELSGELSRWVLPPAPVGRLLGSGRLLPRNQDVAARLIRVRSVAVLRRDLAKLTSANRQFSRKPWRPQNAEFLLQARCSAGPRWKRKIQMLGVCVASKCLLLPVLHKHGCGRSRFYKMVGPATRTCRVGRYNGDQRLSPARNRPTARCCAASPFPAGWSDLKCRLRQRSIACLQGAAEAAVAHRVRRRPTCADATRGMDGNGNHGPWSLWIHISSTPWALSLLPFHSFSPGSPRYLELRERLRTLPPSTKSWCADFEIYTFWICQKLK